MSDTERIEHPLHQQPDQPLTRRTMGAHALAASSVTILGACGAGSDEQAKPTVTTSSISVPTADGDADCSFSHPAQGRYSGVVIWPDIMGLRPAFVRMGQRLAEAGYAVLVINPYYRSAPAPVVSDGDSFQDKEVRARVLPLRRSLSAATTDTDARAMVAFLDRQPVVDTSRRMGSAGYCMGGPMMMRMAAARPDRVGAGASFHGAGIATSAPDSPHLLAPEMQADMLFAIAEDDDRRDPKAKHRLRTAFPKAAIDIYQGALHGWCPPDTRAYNQKQADRAWTHMLALFTAALSPAHSRSAPE